MFALPPKSANTTGASNAAKPASIRVLLLDDSEFDRRRVRRLLQHLDIEVHLDEAVTTQDLQALLDTHIYDVVFLDYRLPVGDGADAVALVRHHRTNSECPAIMIAGDPTLDLGAQVMQDKCDRFLPKAELSTVVLRDALTSMIDVNTLTASNRLITNDLKSRLGADTPAQKVMGEVHDAVLLAALGDFEQIIRDVHNLRHLPKDAPVEHEGDLARIEQRAIRQWRAFRGALAGGDDKVGLLDLAPPIHPNL